MEKNKIWMIIIIALLVVMCAGLTVGFLFTLQQLKQVTLGAEEVRAPVGTVDPKDLIFVSYSDALTNNLLDSNDGSEHVLKLNLSIALNGNDKSAIDLQTLLIEQEVFVKDTVNRIIRNKTYEQIKAPDGESALANEISERLSDKFSTNAIVYVLFSNIIHQ